MKTACCSCRDMKEEHEPDDELSHTGQIPAEEQETIGTRIPDKKSRQSAGFLMNDT